MHGSVTFFSGFRGMKSCHVAPCREVHCKPEILALPFPGCDSALLVEYLLLWGGPGLQDSSLIVPQFGFGILSRSCTLLFLPSPPQCAEEPEPTSSSAHLPVRALERRTPRPTGPTSSPAGTCGTLGLGVRESKAPRWGPALGQAGQEANEIADTKGPSPRGKTRGQKPRKGVRIH